jgi:hypothetical protein
MVCSVAGAHGSARGLALARGASGVPASPPRSIRPARRHHAPVRAGTSSPAGSGRQGAATLPPRRSRSALAQSMSRFRSSYEGARSTRGACAPPRPLLRSRRSSSAASSARTTRSARSRAPRARGSRRARRARRPARPTRTRAMPSRASDSPSRRAGGARASRARRRSPPPRAGSSARPARAARRRAPPRQPVRLADPASLQVISSRAGPLSDVRVAQGGN